MCRGLYESAGGVIRGEHGHGEVLCRRERGGDKASSALYPLSGSLAGGAASPGAAFSASSAAISFFFIAHGKCIKCATGMYQFRRNLSMITSLSPLKSTTISPSDHALIGRPQLIGISPSSGSRRSNSLSLTTL